MTPEEKRIQNNETGAKHGSAVCPACGDSLFWKATHGITYFEGEIALEHERAKPGDKPPRCQGSKEMSFVCEECWPKLSIDERMRHFDALCTKRIEALRPIIYMLSETIVEETQEDGTILPMPKRTRVEDERDRARYDAQKAALQAEHDVVIAAIKAGA